jgi:hypothetical protein
VFPPINPYANLPTSDTAIQVTATRPQLPLLSTLWQRNPFNVGGSAIAIVAGGNSPGNCLVSLGRRTIGENPPSAPDAITILGGGNQKNINMPGCGVSANSNACNGNQSSISLNGNFKFYAGSVSTAGCVNINGSHTIGESPQPSGCTVDGISLCTENYTQNSGQVANPYAGTTIPTTGPPQSGCPSNTCSPGVYTDLRLNGGGTYTLNPGIYILQSSGGNNAALQVGQGTATTVNGTGVTLVFTNGYPSRLNKPMMDIGSNGTLNLTAPTSGSTAGFVIMGDPAMPIGTLFDTSSNPNSTFSGTIYLPNADLQWGGNPVTAGNCLQIITNTITMHGDTNLSNAGCAALGPGQKPIGSVVTLVN